ncbi:hypothetical protein ABZ671_18665 [Micromonospora sp. NPDC006766]|uniref:hypothetical protein n=1 Tax=Micromonospora sp. NPDC006766 TaxID=3154778 RepID=UPI003410C0ED
MNDALPTTRYAVAPWDGREAKDDRRQRSRSNLAGRWRARHLIAWFNRGGDGKWVWGQPGDLTACHLEASKHMSSDRAWGFCQLRHRDALGTWNKPGK